MSDFSSRSWIFLVAASVADVMTVRGIGPFSIIAGLTLALGLALRVEWFVPGLAAGWALLSAPLLVAFGASELVRDRVAVLILTLLATGLLRLIAEVRNSPEGRSTWTDVGSPNGRGPRL